MASYSWVPAFRAISDWIVQYENRQDELVQILRDIGIEKGLDDELADGAKLALTEIDPFTFMAMFMKYGVEKRASLFAALFEHIDLLVPPPTDFDGVPNAQALKVWLFPFAKQREPDMIPNLWKLFLQMRSGNIDGELFNEILRIPHTGFAKLTECLFYLSPDNYFPVDAQTKPWLIRNGRDIPSQNWDSYQDVLQWLADNVKKTYFEISYEAWSENQNKDGNNLPGVYDGEVREGVPVMSDKSLHKKSDYPLNQILYGPPGTGKTYATIEKSVAIADLVSYRDVISTSNSEMEKRIGIKNLYDKLVDDRRIVFTTFHQSFSYEDFVEGIRAKPNEDHSGVTYELEDGIFKTVAVEASRAIVDGGSFSLSSTPRVWKISIGRRNEASVRDAYIAAGEARIGWSRTGDLSVDYDDRTKDEQVHWDSLSAKNRSALNEFSEGIEVGDVLLCLKGLKAVQAIGVVTSDYSFDPTVVPGEGYAHVRKVNWLLTDIDFNVVSLNKDRRLVQQTLYQLWRMSWDDITAELDRQGYALPRQSPVQEGVKRPNYVIIIDEINRGNIARIFGELITLLEPDKRKGEDDARTVTLPYSKSEFSVPSNLYVIGTMNTADKSLVQVDLALRRRFSFVEVLPDPNLLKGISVHEVPITKLLSTINSRIEVLLDRDHLIGHSYFWSLKALETEAEKEAELAHIFEGKVIPLLQEYFFSDWERISWVLNDVDKPKHRQFIQLEPNVGLSSLFSSKISSELSDRRYTINISAFKNPLSYRGVLGVEQN